MGNGVKQILVVVSPRATIKLLYSGDEFPRNIKVVYGTVGLVVLNSYLRIPMFGP
jgi:hypothetical protein